MGYHEPNLKNEHQDYKSLLLNLRHQDTLDLRQGLISPLVRYTRKKPARSRAKERRSRSEDGSELDIEDEDEDGYGNEDDSMNWVVEGGVGKRIKGEDKEEGDGRLGDLLGSSTPLAQARPVLQRIPPEDEKTLFPLYFSQLPPPPFETLADEVLLLAKAFLKQNRTRCSRVKSIRSPSAMNLSQTVESSLPTNSVHQPPSAQPQPRSPVSPFSRAASLSPPPPSNHHPSHCSTQDDSEISGLAPQELVHSTRSLLALTLDGLSKVTPVDTFGTARAKKKKLRDAEPGWERVLNVLSGLDRDSLDPVVKERTIARLEKIYGPRKCGPLDYYGDKVDELANDSDLNPGRSKRRNKTRHKRNAPLLTKKERTKQEEARFKSRESLDRQFTPTSFFRPRSTSSYCSSSCRGSQSIGSSNIVETGIERRARKRTRRMSEESITSHDNPKDEGSSLDWDEGEDEEEEEDGEEGEEQEEEAEKEKEMEEEDEERIGKGRGLTIFHSPFIPPRKRLAECSKNVKEP